MDVTRRRRRSTQQAEDLERPSDCKTLVWSSNNDPFDRARLLAASAPPAGDWPLTAPIGSCGLGLSNEAVRVAIGLRLGLKLCAPHQCQCGETTDPRGHHGLVCKKSGTPTHRHF